MVGNIDIGKVCPELAELSRLVAKWITDKADEENEDGWIQTENDIIDLLCAKKKVEAIKACMLALAEENERLEKRLKKAVQRGFDMGKTAGSYETSSRNKKKSGRSEPC